MQILGSSFLVLGGRPVLRAHRASLRRLRYRLRYRLDGGAGTPRPTFAFGHLCPSVCISDWFRETVNRPPGTPTSTPLRSLRSFVAILLLIPGDFSRNRTQRTQKEKRTELVPPRLGCTNHPIQIAIAIGIAIEGIGRRTLQVEQGRTALPWTCVRHGLRPHLLRSLRSFVAILLLIPADFSRNRTQRTQKEKRTDQSN